MNVDYGVVNIFLKTTQLEKKKEGKIESNDVPTFGHNGRPQNFSNKFCLTRIN